MSRLENIRKLMEVYRQQDFVQAVAIAKADRTAYTNTTYDKNGNCCSKTSVCPSGVGTAGGWDSVLTRCL